MQEQEINLITAGSKFEGTIEFSGFTRFEGYLQGVLKGTVGSELILGKNAVVEGKIEGDLIVVDGFVRGEIKAKTKVIVSSLGRVVGQIEAPNVGVEFGAYFEGKCLMSTTLPVHVTI